ncbi:MAG TPA: TetR/AcrR family transcriptional regulator [Gemmatimonadaceae bacterium]|jgi:TetR/AcrR family transcriptional repressor of nem operon|nr:TetR/AcrR family transcriptional regulator [Gemmatimonadaceae bacterium]
MSKRQDVPGTASRILDVAEGLVQTRGFNGFSYADVAAELQVTNASLHYHYRGKAELGEALITRYTSRFGQALDAIDRAGDAAPVKLAAYSRIYADVLRQGRMCLCGMLAADYDTLPDAMRSAVVLFFDASERWLVRVLEQGRADGTLEFTGSVVEVARSIVSGLEGALLIARPYGDVSRFEAAADRLLAGLATSPARHH